MLGNLKMRGTQKRRIALLKYWLPKKFRKMKSKNRKNTRKNTRKTSRKNNKKNKKTKRSK